MRERAFGPSKKESENVRTSKLSPDSFRVKVDKVINKVASGIFGSGSDEPLYDNRSGKSAELQRARFAEIKKTAEKEWLPEFKQQFVEKANNLIQSGELNISLDELKKRIAGIKISFFNQGTMASKKFDAGGLYGADSILVGINFSGQEDRELIKADSQHIFNHEMLHAISGALYVTRVKRQGLHGVQRQRTGLRFESVGENEFERFAWLNEAVTETLALEMDDDLERDLAPYREERILFSLLVNGPAGRAIQGVERKKFSHAYFENYEPKDASENRLEHWKELVRSISESYYPGFLVKIDKLIKEKGIGYVITHFHILCESESVQ